MVLSYIKIFFSRNDVQIMIVCTLTGGILQVLAKRYLKNHPELSDHPPVIQTNDREPRKLSPRGGAFVEFTFSGISVKIITKIVVNFLAKKGLMVGLTTGSCMVIKKLPITAISTYLRDAFPQNLPDLEKKKLILISGEKFYLDPCNQNLKYFFQMLEDPTIPFEEKEKIARSILTNYLDMKTPKGRLTFVLCLVLVLWIFSIQDRSSFYILLKNLIKAIKEGRISKAMGRLIVRRLQKKGIAVDPELLEVVSS
jgi:hypothetical protein